jgi:hypothetical protein
VKRRDLRRPRRDDESRYEIVEEQRGYELVDDEAFDRIAFAMRALEILRPRGMRVVVYERIAEFHVERGPALGPSVRGAPDREWAMVGIPPHASRERIAWGLATLAGVAHIPFMIDVLLDRTRSPYRSPGR